MTGVWRAYRYLELKECLQNRPQLALPIENGQWQGLTRIQWARLAYIASAPARVGETEEHLHIRQQLVTQIDHYLHGIDLAPFQRLRTQVVEPLDKLELVDIARELEKLAMTFRGWSGEGPYPVRDVFRHLGHDARRSEQRQIEALANFINKLEMFPHGTMIQLLPTYRFEGRYIPSRLTLSERLDKIAEGEHADDVGACILVNANYLACTSYLLLKTLDIVPSYNIMDWRCVEN